MEKETNIHVAKIAIVPWDEATKKETYKKLDDWRYYCWKLATETYSQFYSLYMDSYRIAKATEESIGDVKKKLMENHLSYTEGTNKASEQNYANMIYKASEYKDNLQSNIAGAITQRTMKQFKADWKDVVKGNKSIRSYRRDKMDIPFPVGVAKKDKEGEVIHGEYMCVGIQKIDKEFQLRIPSQRDMKMRFKLFFGRDRSNNRDIVNRILTGEYKLCDSYIKKSKKGYVFYMITRVPKKDKYLDPSRCVGVDLGISIPAVCAVNEGYERKFIGSGKEVWDFRSQITARKRSIQRTTAMAKGGHGRNRKCKASESLREKESNWVKTYNHKVSKEIINFAIKNNCGVIKMEFLDGFGSQHKENIVLKNWTYHQLQEMVQYKAEREGIEVIYVDPYHTSKTCSFCGKLHEGLSLKDREIECECGEKYNRDYNAAVNIARSSNMVTKKEDCTYYKLHKKKAS